MINPVELTAGAMTGIILYVVINAIVSIAKHAGRIADTLDHWYHNPPAINLDLGEVEREDSNVVPDK